MEGGRVGSRAGRVLSQVRLHDRSRQALSIQLWGTETGLEAVLDLRLGSARGAEGIAEGVIGG